MEWPSVPYDNPYIFYLPTKPALIEKALEEFLKKVKAQSTKILSVFSADSFDKAKLSEVIVNIEYAQGKKIVKDTQTLDAEAFFSLEVAENLWSSFVGQNWPTIEIAEVKNADAFEFEKVTKVGVRFVGATEAVIIFKEHFIQCAKSQEEWNDFAYAKLGKRDKLMSFEEPCRKLWDDKKVWQVDAVEGAEKWVGTFPYPYMNGALHLGHSFTISKIDFAVGYHRLKGKKALFPFAFHCTGMPIKSCADKLKREIDTYGAPPDWNKVEEAVQQPTQEAPETVKRVTAKAAQKTGTSKFQWQIMESIGIPSGQIPMFSDARHWLDFFPDRAVADLKAMGAKIDWRRSFITTDVNPYYDAFIRWQFNKLHAMDKIKFGKRPTVYSPLDAQPCMDHDRQTGEGVGLTEYVLIKQELLKPYPVALKHLEDLEQKVYLVPATLRPETMYGQTNCWVLPTGDYGAFEISSTDIFVCTPRAARNLAFQTFSPVEGQVKTLATFKGEALIGCKVKAPLSTYEEVFVLPMFTVKTSKTTGVVTSVPSDSPDDFAAYRDLETKKDTMRERFGITPEMFSYAPVPIINIPEFGDLSAPTVVEQLKIRSQNDTALLIEAKDRVYLKGFTDGTMLVGTHQGLPVKEAKPLIRQMLIDQGLAIVYREPDGEVISRSGDECVAALCDQWYLDYGEKSWQADVQACISKMDTFDSQGEVRNQLTKAVEIIHQWACSRSYGLGSKIPWDEQYLVESLSDSTIYMAYYTIAHILQGEDNLDGSKTGPGGITPAQLTDEVFEFIFGNGPFPTTDIPQETLEHARREFKSWYPLDLRATGKDLIPNHIVFWLYNHVTFFPPEQWPAGLKANGWLLLNGEKMAKRTGNFVTLADACKRYGCDAMRFALATAGDGMDDPNFTVENVDTATLQIFTLMEWIEEMLNCKDQMKHTEPTNFAERLFNVEMNQAIAKADHHYSRLEFRSAVTFGFFEMQKVRDVYIKRVKAVDQLNWNLIERFIRSILIMMAPIISHTAEYLWNNLLHEQDTIFNASFPVPVEADESILPANRYVQKLISDARDTLTGRKKKNFAAPTEMRIYYFTKFPEWTERAVNLMKEYLDAHGSLDDQGKDIKLCPFLLKDPELKKQNKKLMGFVAATRTDFQQNGPSALDLVLPFNEEAVLSENLDFITMQLGVPSILIRDGNTEDDSLLAPETRDKLQSGGPSKPLIFWS